jgi:CHRD domain
MLLGGVAAASGHEWKARRLTGANEVPANTSTASAKASFEMEEDGMIHYKIRIKSPIKGAFMAHIHLAEAGKNGPIAVWLYGGPPANPANAKDFAKGETLARGSFDASAIQIAGLTLDQLMARMDAGTAYVNVHTKAIPSGEIRAQIVRNIDKD